MRSTHLWAELDLPDFASLLDPRLRCYEIEIASGTDGRFWKTFAFGNSMSYLVADDCAEFRVTGFLRFRVADAT